MNLKYIKKDLFYSLLLVFSGSLYAQESEIKKDGSISLRNISDTVYRDFSPLLYHPFPKKPLSLVQPIDSLSQPKGIVKLNLGNNKYIVELSDDWNDITISKLVNGKKSTIPHTSSLKWYVDQLHKLNWENIFLEIMIKESKDDGKKRKGQMLELVGVDMGRLGRASLQVSGNVNINGKMVFQDQELVRSTLNETQNTHLEFDQKQNLNIQGKIGDRITVAMDQDSERDFDWENNNNLLFL